MSAAAAPTTLRLGTRSSPLAMYQARRVRDAIIAADPAVVVELVDMTSDGDRDPRELRDIGERGIFAAHLERALVAGEIDAAVHSSKDLPLDPHPELVLVAWPEREDPRDALVGSGGLDLDELPHGATVATGSARRTASLQAIRADLQVQPIRGNVATRIERSAARGDAACLLAMAGLRRLGLADGDVRALAVDRFVPEAGQGALVVQAVAHTCARSGFAWHRIDDVATRRTVELERELARMLGGGCSTPVGVHVRLEDGIVHAFAAADGAVGRVVTHEVLGLELAPLLSVRTARDIADAVRWIADRLAPQLGARLDVEVVQ